MLIAAAAPKPSLSPAMADEPREFSEQDWERLWARFLAAIEGRVPVRDFRRLRSAAPPRRAELLRSQLHLGRLPEWRFANLFEAMACDLERAYSPRPAKAPTAARPGSAEKVAVMAARALAGEELHHPDDESVPVWTPPEE